MTQPTDVAVDQHDIARLESHVLELDDEARVELTLSDGSRIRGTVAMRPTVQVFRDANGAEGINGLVRLDDEAGHAHMVWLTQVLDVTRYGSA